MKTVQDLINELQKVEDKDSLVFLYDLDKMVCYPMDSVDEHLGIVDINFRLSKPRQLEATGTSNEQ